jgi:hypothetical protein
LLLPAAKKAILAKKNPPNLEAYTSLSECFERFYRQTRDEKRATLRFHCELSAFSEIDLACAENRDLRDVFHRLWDPDNWNASGQKSLPKLMFGEIARR